MSMMKKFYTFLGFIAIIVIISVGVTVYFYQKRTTHLAQFYASILKSHGLMIKEAGMKIEELGADVSAYRRPESGVRGAPENPPALAEYGEKVRQQGKELQQYAVKLMQAAQSQSPGSALANSADISLMVPENLNIIKADQAKIDGLEREVLRQSVSIKDLQQKLYQCRQQFFKANNYN